MRSQDLLEPHHCPYDCPDLRDQDEEVAWRAYCDRYGGVQLRWQGIRVMRCGACLSAENGTRLARFQIYIRNLRDHIEEEDLGHHVRVDRQTPLGNPFNMRHRTLEERNRVCDQYAEWYQREMENEHSPVRQERDRLLNLARTGDLYLYCWCAPLRCHAETIQADLYRLLTEGGVQ